MSSAKALGDDPSIAREAARIRQARGAQERQFAGWDALTRTEAFARYLASRGLEMRPTLAGLPHAPEAESACLGAMLLDAQAVRQSLEQLRPRCFGREQNALVFLSIAVLSRREDAPIDFITVASRLRREGHLERVGGTSYLCALIDSCPSALNVGAYIREILECSRLRHQMEMGEMIRLVASRGAPPDQIGNGVRKTLDALDLRGYADLKALFETPK